jgi:hypothetical protein
MPSEEIAVVKFYRVTGFKAVLPRGTYVVLTQAQLLSRPLQPVEGEADLYEALDTLEFKAGEVIGLVEDMGKGANLEEVVPEAKAPKGKKPTKAEQKAMLAALLAIPEAERTDDQWATIEALQEKG